MTPNESPITLARIKRRARVIAGRWRFESAQLAANTTMPLIRRLLGVDEPIADQYLIVMAHPRSGSTVLTHVLNHHPEIVGFGEHHVDYTDEDSLRALAARTAYYAKSPRLRTRFVVDKIVKGIHTVSLDVLRCPSTRFIFLVREPSETLASYGRIFHDLTDDASRLVPYRNRLVHLVDQAKTIDDPKRAFFITYDDLTSDTATALDSLTDWLSLGSPLKQEYELTAKTGRQSWGDPSDTIKAGRIVQHDREVEPLDPEVGAAAERVYASTVRTMQTLCSSVRRSPAPSPGEVPLAAGHREPRSAD